MAIIPAFQRGGRLSLIVAILFSSVLAGRGRAEVILSDSFTVSTNVTSNAANYSLETRQTGTLATSEYTVLNSGLADIQLGNTSQDVGQPGGASNGDYLLMAGNAQIYNNLLIDDSVAQGQPLRISLNIYARTDSEFNDESWMGLTLQTPFPATVWPVNGADQFGFIVKQGGPVQIFNASTPTSFYDGIAIDPFWSFTFTDTAGTGSAFSGNGSKVIIYNGDELVGEFDLEQLSEFGLVLGIRAYSGTSNTMIGGFSDLVIETLAVPEPSGLALFALGGGAFLVMRRRRRQHA